MSRLTVEALFNRTAINGQVVQRPRWAPSGAALAYLANPVDDRERLDLWLFDLATGRAKRLLDASRFGAGGELDDAEKAARERRRAFEAGVTDYRWLADGGRIACSIDGAIWLIDVNAGESTCITPPDTRQTDLEVSPRGRYVSYVRAANLFVYDLADGSERQMTNDGGDTIASGTADFIAQEEMHRFNGHWWSPDDRWIVYTRVDESPIPVSHRYEFGVSELTVHEQRYPFAGTANARVELYVFDLETASRRRLEYADADDDYLARVTVTADAVMAQVQRRDQRLLSLKAIPLTDGEARILLREEQPAWVNLHDNFRAVGSSGGFVWTSERSGNAELYVYRSNRCEQCSGNLARVNSILWADATSALVLGWQDTPTEQHLFRIDYASPATSVRLTQRDGWYDGAVDPSGRWFAARHSSLRSPISLQVVDLTGKRPSVTVVANELTAPHPYRHFIDAHVGATLGRIEAADGQALHYRLTLPHGFAATRRWPVLIHVYGGPGVQRVRDEWAPLMSQLFAAAGIAVFELDNRGSSNRNKSFEDALAGCLGRVEVEDQLKGLDFLVAQPWVDRDRIGVMGHSYGGYMALQLMMRSNGRLRAGIAGAPVTDWRLYDTHYTERYLGKPQDNPDGYDASSVFAHLTRIDGALLLIHGMADDNVLVGHTTKLMHALQQDRQAFELMLYPGAKHSLQEPAVAIHHCDTMLDFLKRHLVA